MKKTRNWALLGVLLAALGTTAAGGQEPASAPETKAPAPVQVQNAPAPAPMTAGERSHLEQLKNDWPFLARYKEADLKMTAPAPGENRVVFMGDSITEGWHLDDSFPGKPYVNRGISGQTTPQMVVRFHQDVVNLKPKVVVILAATNDVAQNTGPMTPEMTMDNFRAMVEMARANGIKPVITSILPAGDFPWKRGMEPAPKIRALNDQLQAWCQSEGIVWVDYYSAMADAAGAMKQGLSVDGVHPNATGYAIMAPLAEAGIQKALAK